MKNIEFVTPGKITNWPNHDGSLNKPEAGFFVEPQVEIGQIVSASTTYLDANNPKVFTKTEKARRVGIIVLAIIFGGFITGPVVFGLITALSYLGMPALYKSTFSLLAFVVVTVLFTIWVGVKYRPRRYCSYVGDSGLQKSILRPILGLKTEVMRFADAHDLTVTRINQYVNGVYTGMYFTYLFRDANKKTLFKINGNGRYKNQAVPPATDDIIWFGQQAEKQWMKLRGPRLDQEFQSRGVVWFDLDNKTRLGIKKDAVEMVYKGKNYFVPASDITQVFLKEGFLHIHFNDPQKQLPWSIRKSYYRVAGIPNFELFMIFFEKITGRRVGY